MKYFGDYLDMFVNVESQKTKKPKKKRKQKEKTKKKTKKSQYAGSWNGIV